MLGSSASGVLVSAPLLSACPAWPLVPFWSSGLRSVAGSEPLAAESARVDMSSEIRALLREDGGGLLLHG